MTTFSMFEVQVGESAVDFFCSAVVGFCCFCFIVELAEVELFEILLYIGGPFLTALVP